MKFSHLLVLVFISLGGFVWGQNNEVDNDTLWNSMRVDSTAIINDADSTITTLFIGKIIFCTTTEYRLKSHHKSKSRYVEYNKDGSIKRITLRTIRTRGKQAWNQPRWTKTKVSVYVNGRWRKNNRGWRKNAVLL